MTVSAARTTTRKSGIGSPPFAAHAFWRLLILTAAFGLFIILLIGRMATLALFESTRAFGATTTDYVPDRGDIVDRDGQPLARTMDAWSIAVHPSKIIGDKIALAAKLAALPPLGLAAIKSIIRTTGARTLDEELDLQRDEMRRLGFTHDYREGVAAFLEKRPATFTGK